MKILVSGSHGMVGTELVQKLRAQKHQVFRLVRPNAAREPNTIDWDPEAGKVPAGELEGFEAVVHLAGESVSKGRWNEAKKKRIMESRSKGTRALSEALAKLTYPPKVLVSASAIGYYGDRGEETLTEKSGPGENFLADVCREWEAATAPAEKKGIRVVNLRIGVILGPDGGALQKMLPPFKMGLGGRIGSGKQWMSWITIDDVLKIIQFAIDDETLKGPINVVSPEPVTNHDFAYELGTAVGKSAKFPMPAFMAKLLFGKMADELLLASTRVLPFRLKQANYQFLYPKLDTALRHLIGEAKT